ncbi:MAG: aspartate/ornithine carbamoyltransferase family protein, partial [Candidatus Bilamarchaeaceae archaeon]
MMNLISMRDVSKDMIEDLLSLAAKKEKQMKESSLKPTNKVVATLFFEPSTRTKLSFQTAALRLGMNYIDFLTETSSLKKGESFIDTIKVVAGYGDILVIRHPKEGSARLASEICDRVIINGGDGGNQHPTQTILDLYTIKKCQGKIDGLNIAMSGDLKYGRTVHSLATALTHFKCTLHFVAPDSL